MAAWAITLLSVIGVLVLIFAAVELHPHHRFIDAAGKKDPGKLAKWLAKNPDVNKPGLFGVTALACAVTENRVENVKALLERGADPNKLSMKMLPLQSAIDHEKPEITELLLEFGADPQAEGIFGSSPIRDAADQGKADHLRIFILHGVDLNRIGSDGNPLLVSLLLSILASKEPKRVSQRECLKILLDAGASPNLRAKDDVPPVLVALQDPPSLRLLVDAGAIQDVSYEGRDLKQEIEEVLRSLEANQD
ncbi:MAG: ankyrin repeat domain-containing protein [Fimbriimonadaceae bacterium]|jgi:ankyrin repeat protein|nr:ankyrin repeat domain-containing protein [Fimbriimonadaceae bacterium]